MNNLSFFEKTVQVVDRYGSWKVFQAIIYLGLFLFIIFYIPAITRITVEKVTTESINSADKDKETKHLENLELRKEMQPQIYATLGTFLEKTKADRAFIIELHNGSNNLNGVPFLHGSVTYDKSREGLEPIDEDYQNLSLSRFSMSTYLHANYSYMGSVAKLSTIDKKLSTKLIANDVKYLAVMTLHNGYNEWGWFGLLYNRETDIPSEKEILNEMMVASQSITKTLSTIK